MSHRLIVSDQQSWGLLRDVTWHNVRKLIGWLTKFRSGRLHRNSYKNQYCFTQNTTESSPDYLKSYEGAAVSRVLWWTPSQIVLDFHWFFEQSRAQHHIHSSKIMQIATKPDINTVCNFCPSSKFPLKEHDKNSGDANRWNIHIEDLEKNRYMKLNGLMIPMLLLIHLRLQLNSNGQVQSEMELRGTGWLNH